MNETASPISDIAAALQAMAQSAAGSQADSFEMRRILRFIGQVVQVVDQSFESVYALLIDISSLTDADFAQGRHVELRRELDLILAKSHFREATEICSRLRYLGDLYGTAIAPIVTQQGIDSGPWADIFSLINEYEGAIIIRVEETVFGIGERLVTVTPDNAADLRRTAREQAMALRRDLNKLRELNSKILGLSGHAGLLELTATGRESLGQILIADTIDQRYMDQREGTFMGDTFSNISNSTIINRSTVENAIIAAQNIGGDESAAALKEVAEAVAKSGDEEAGLLLDQFNEELAKPQPRKSLLKRSWDGLVEVLPEVAKIAGASAAIAKLFL